MGTIDLIQTIGIGASLLISIIIFLISVKNSKVQTLFSVNQAHREVWGRIFETPVLSRVFLRNVDLDKEPVTEEERTFMIMLILHGSVCRFAIKNKTIYSIEGMKADWIDILSYPIPAAVWKEVRNYQDRHFVSFIEDALREESRIDRGPLSAKELDRRIGT